MENIGVTTWLASLVWPPRVTARIKLVNWRFLMQLWPGPALTALRRVIKRGFELCKQDLC